MAREKDYNREFKVSYGPACRVTVNGQSMGYSGTDAYRIYGATDDDKKYSFGVSQSGKMEINSDVSIEIVAGEENGKKGEDIIINSRNGNIDIVASANGCIKIKCGGSIAFESTDVSFVCKEFKVNGNKIVLDANTVESRAIDGNLAPPGETFIEKAFEGTFVGEDVIQNTLKQDC
jgi:hypothetical protein